MKAAVISSSVRNGVTLQTLYLSSRNWLSYIEFFEDEIKFFKKLLMKYFLSDANDDNVNKIHLINTEIKRLERQKNQVLNDIFCYQSNLKATLEDMMQLSEQYLTVQHNKIQEEVKGLQPVLDQIKQELYIITEQQLKDRKSE
ncbi:hypothetical protein BDE36_0599 [Arcticibacter tournemirensis]|uniref:Uncharacterized protein n=1 Tax=Arcticibacter tournemirensis TaxID=699437 RepID=A0A4Q0ME25_9SPHI|nr:hypothetical protein [Arcticibacter tournemirensis]KAA8481692.1 hypothetical protein F1649_14245 [Arcticibacter tournemirensis]RXF71670.1 hypothetical protein EKH83_02995 [Arcticibacter tournemirensis]TQM48907.1 hypothetical protein BDE36_0599 [Arcticibacter tournemirensis]